MLELLAPTIDQIIITQSDSPRAIPYLELSELAGQFFQGRPILAASNLTESLDMAKDLLKQHSLTHPKSRPILVITGSITLVGDYFKEQPIHPR
jgi:dihydrofolate synthase/folylpolyglutamate synthase